MANMPRLEMLGDLVRTVLAGDVRVTGLGQLHEQLVE
jgi:hypothetical protein